MNTIVSFNPKTLSDIFLLHPDRWIQGNLWLDRNDKKASLYDQACKCCLHGAITLIHHKHKYPLHLIDERSKLLARIVGTKFIGQWNDDPTRTINDIKRVTIEFDQQATKLKLVL